MRKRLFLSYSRRDQRFAEELRERLLDKGLFVEEPSPEAAVGERWVESIRKDIESADAILAVVPESGRGTANNVFFEIGFARALDKPILAVIPEDENREIRRELPSGLRGMIVLDAENKTIEAVANTLIRTLAAA